MGRYRDGSLFPPPTPVGEEGDWQGGGGGGGGGGAGGGAGGRAYNEGVIEAGAYTCSLFSST